MAENDFNEIFGKIAANPDIVEKLTSITQGVAKENTEEGLSKIMETISPLINKSLDNQKEEKTDTPSKKNDEQNLSLPLSKLTEKIAKNTKLLIALKPYLSQERCEIIDAIIKVAQVGDFMKLVK